MGQTRSEFRNDSSGVAGAMQIGEDGKPIGVAVQPGDSVWLTEDERIATANAPRLDDDNPFQNGTFTLLTPAAEIKNRRHIGPDEVPAEGPPEPPENSTSVEPSDEEIEAEAAARREQQDNIARAAAAQNAKNAAEAARATAAGEDTSRVETKATPSAEAKAAKPAAGSRPAQEVVATPPAKE